MRRFAGRAERAAHAAPPVIPAPSLLGAGTVLVTARGYALYMVAPVGAQEGDVHEWVRGGLAAGHAPGRVVTRHGLPLCSCAGDTRSGEAASQALEMDGGLW